MAVHYERWLGPNWFNFRPAITQTSLVLDFSRDENIVRKIDPEGVWEDFESQLNQQFQYYENSLAVLPTAADEKIAAENYALAVGVMFEGYINDLIFAYANRDCSQVFQHLDNCIRECLKTTQKAQTAFAKFGDFKRRKHLSRDELTELLDPEGRNTSFPNYEAIEERAKQWLAAAHRAKFTNMSAQHRAVIDATISARNNLAHRSKASLDRVNKVFEAGALQPTGLKRNVNRIQQAGYFLKSRTQAGETRVTVLVRLLTAAGRGLVY